MYVCILCSSQIKNYIRTGLDSNFLMQHVRGWHFLCRKEHTISLQRVCTYQWQRLLSQFQTIHLDNLSDLTLLKTNVLIRNRTNWMKKENRKSLKLPKKKKKVALKGKNISSLSQINIICFINYIENVREEKCWNPLKMLIT